MFEVGTRSSIAIAEGAPPHEEQCAFKGCSSEFSVYNRFNPSSFLHKNRSPVPRQHVDFFLDFVSIPLDTIMKGLHGMILGIMGVATFISAGASIIPSGVASTRQVDCSSDIILPAYSYKDHPLHNSRLFTDPLTGSKEPAPEPAPAVIARYTNTDAWKFKPRSVTVSRADGGTPKRIVQSVDALVYQFEKRQKEGTDITLNHDARVYIFVEGPSVKPGQTGEIEVTANKDSYLDTVDRFDSSSDVFVAVEKNGEQDEWGVLLEMKDTAKASETLTIPPAQAFRLNGAKAYEIKYVILAHPRKLNTMDDEEIIPFKEPPLPPASAVNIIFDRMDEETRKNKPAVEKVTPNERCPTWLHDIHVAPGKLHEQDVISIESEAQQYWRTWHPLIDPIYWCYYGHEHGGFPGSYPPWFGYTASKTAEQVVDDSNKFWEEECTVPKNKEPTGELKPQSESNEGFKIFMFSADTNSATSTCSREDKRVFMITLHAELSNPRRFTSRHHTMIIDVFRVLADQEEAKKTTFGDGWVRELHLQFKADFGRGMGRVARAVLSGENKQEANAHIVSGPCEDQVDRNVTEAFRRFNVHLTYRHPDGTEDDVRLDDTNMDYDEKTKENARHGFMLEELESRLVNPKPAEDIKYASDNDYEKWVAPLIHTCLEMDETQAPTGRFDFQFRDSSSFMEYFVDSGTFEKTNVFKNQTGADSMQRAIEQGGVIFNKDNCSLENEDHPAFSTGKFYTDVKFTEVRDGPSSTFDPKYNSVIQYISPDLKRLHLEGGKAGALDDWTGHMVYYPGGEKGLGGFANIEGAVEQDEN